MKGGKVLPVHQVPMFMVLLTNDLIDPKNPLGEID